MIVMPAAHHIAHMHHPAAFVAVAIGAFVAIGMSLWVAISGSRKNTDVDPNQPPRRRTRL